MSPRVGRRACRSCAARSGSSRARSPPSPRRAVDHAPAIMALASRRSRRPSIDIWPGFVDALAQLLMVIIFILLVFTAGQFFLADALSGRDKALHELQQQISELGKLLALERTASADLRASTADLATQLKAKESERAALAARAEQSEKALAGEQQTSAASRSQVEQLTASVAALREQLAQIAAALELAESKVKDQQTQITDLGRRLNLALASKMMELARYRSEFFGRLREIIGNRADVRIVGDRFVFQSEVLFEQGSAELADTAKDQLDPVITALQEISQKIPPDINWVLRIDGHTDRRPINTAQFPSNWELSTARAISVVRYAIDKGIPPNRLTVAGFADKQPLDLGNSEEAYRRNRRIEMKLTER